MYVSFQGGRQNLPETILIPPWLFWIQCSYGHTHDHPSMIFQKPCAKKSGDHWVTIPKLNHSFQESPKKNVSLFPSEVHPKNGWDPEMYIFLSPNPVRGWQFKSLVTRCWRNKNAAVPTVQSYRWLLPRPPVNVLQGAGGGGGARFDLNVVIRWITSHRPPQKRK